MNATARRRVLLLVAVGLAACGGEDASLPSTEFIAVRRAWRPGERDSVRAFVLANRAYNIPGVGELSDYVDLILHTDSTTDFVANPNYIAPSVTAWLEPVFSLNGLRVPGAGWTSTGLDVRLVNNNIGEPDYDWLGVFWSNNTDPTRKGILLAATAASTFPTTTVNTTVFDATNVGAGASEINPTTIPFTYYENRGEGGTYRVVSTTFFGSPTTVTTGPFLGGTVRNGVQNEVISSVVMTRRSGTGAPASLTASLSGSIGAAELICIFPTPCTTNVPGLAQAALRGPLPDSLYVKLPWIASLPVVERAAHLQLRGARLAAAGAVVPSGARSRR